MNTVRIKKDHVIKFIIYVLLLIPFFEPGSISVLYPKIDNIVYEIMFIVSLIIIILLTVKKGIVSKICLYIFIYIFYLFCITILYNGNIKLAVKLGASVIGISLLVEYALHNDVKIFLQSFEFILYTLIIINFISILIYPNGMYGDNQHYYENWFLGYRNSHILFMLPAIIISCINSYYTYGKLKTRNYVLILIIAISLLIIKSVTSIIGVMIIVLFILLSKFKHIPKPLNIKNYTIGYIVLFISIVVLRIHNILQIFISNMFNRNATLTNRTYIWDYIFDFIKERPLFGYGIEYKIDRFYKTDIYQSYHAHDQLLEVIYKSGIIGAIMFIYIAFLSFKKLYLYKNEIIAQFLSVCMFAMMVIMITEAYSFEFFMYLFVINYNVKCLIKSK